MKIKIGFFSAMLFLSLILTHSSFAIAAFLAVFIHEMGHILSARLCGIGLSECKISIYGARLRPSTHIFSYKDEILLCISGPVINYLSSLLLMPVYLCTENKFVLYFISSSLVLGTFNLLPVKDFDGGRILYSLLCIFVSPEKSEKALSVLSFIIIFIFWSVSIYLLITVGSNLSLFIFSLSLFSKIFVSDFEDR